VGTVQVALAIRFSELGSSFFGHFEHRVNVGERDKSDKLSRDVGQRGNLLLKFGDSARQPATTVLHAADLLTFRQKVLCELSGERHDSRWDERV